MISFSEPFFLYLLVPVTVAFLVWSAVAVFRIYSRPKISYGSKYPLLGKVKLWGLFVLPASVFMVLALAKPIMPGSSVRPSTGDIQVVLLLDSSISMRADDVKLSRLEIAKREISRMGAMLREGDKVALFTFGKSSNRKLYLTKDLETFFDQVERISFPTKLSNDESVWSTDFATALEHIYQSMDMQDSRGENYPAGRKYNPKKRDNRIVIIFSDGEDQMLNSMPANEQEIQQKAGYIDRRKKVLAEYKKRGLKIYPVGVGTSRGV
ncbi:MAG: VWA domain-containing protein, partial [Candidatus Colwellbacteria bacterium]|nr:VWA domain-containing protein [Candidatus Colwellbacteria bacterium]